MRTNFGADGIEEPYYGDDCDDDYYISLGPADERDQCEGAILEEFDSQRNAENTENVEHEEVKSDDACDTALRA